MCSSLWSLEIENEKGEQNTNRRSTLQAGSTIVIAGSFRLVGSDPMKRILLLTFLIFEALSFQSIAMTSAASTQPLSPYAQERLNAIIADPMLFNETLKLFHARNGFRFKVPIVGRRHLDLHKLFVEITAHGGIQKVAKERQVKEISRAFNFPPTVTNISFVLKRYYYMLLYHFEQVYFFGANEADVMAAALVEKAPFIVAAVDSAKPNNSALVEVGSGLRRGDSPVQPIVEAQVEEAGLEVPAVELDMLDSTTPVEVRSRQRKCRSPARAINEVTPQSMAGAPVVGVVDSDFNEGYYITVTVGEHKLMKGMVFKNLGQSELSVVTVSPGGNGTVNARSDWQCDKALKVRKLNPLVRKFKEGRNLYFKEQQAKLKPLVKGKELKKLIDDQWDMLPEDRKVVYQENGTKFEEKRKREMRKDRKRMKAQTSDILQEVVPSSEVLALPAPALESGRDESRRLELDVNRSPAKEASEEGNDG